MGEFSGAIQVLLVDDDPDFVEMAASMLEDTNEQFEVVQASNSREGLQRLAEADIECIVADYAMEDRDGIEFLERVREQYGDLPYLLLTGKGSEKVAAEAISKGVTDYIQKGTGSDLYTLLANRISNAVERYRAEQDRDRKRKTIESTREQIDEELTFINQALDLLDDVFYVIDPDGSFRRWNESLSEVTGYSDDEIEDMLAMDFFPEDEQEQVAEAIDQALTTGRNVLQTEVLNRDGRRIPFEIKGSRLTDSEGNVTGVIGIGRDITERQKREDQLRQLKEEYETVFNTAQDAIFLFDVDHIESGHEFRLRHLNPAHEALSGLSIEDDRGKTPVELLGEEAGEEVVKNYLQCVENREPISYEEQLEMPTGTIHSQTKVAPVVKDDEVTQIVGIARDITEMKEYELELERYATIVEATGDPVYTLDAEASFTYVNDAFLEFSGYDEEALLGADASVVMEQEDYERGNELIRSLLSSEEHRGTFELDFVTADGARVPCENHVALLPFEDEFRGTVGIIRDISDRVERERRLKRERDRLDEFASVVSHDLRNPLNVAEGRLDMVAEECESEHLEAVDSAVARMGTLIDDMLSLASAGRDVGEPERIELSKLVSNCWANVATASAELVTETDATVRADRTRLQQLLENLLRNAVEHGGDNVSIEIGDLPGGFYVEDDGSGIPEAERDDVLDPGYSSTQDGTGFGLSIVRDIAQAHGWEIRVTEGSDGGARFEFSGVEME